MMKLKIVKHPRLEKVRGSDVFVEVDEELLESMVHVMLKNNGVGLAANQIGLDLPLAIIDCTQWASLGYLKVFHDMDHDRYKILTGEHEGAEPEYHEILGRKIFVLWRPHIRKLQKSYMAEEGCLSFDTIKSVLSEFSKRERKYIRDNGLIHNREFMFRPTVRFDRFQEIAFDSDGVKYVATNEIAHIIQHEVDHLHGKTIVDNLRSYLIRKV